MLNYVNTWKWDGMSAILHVRFPDVTLDVLRTHVIRFDSGPKMMFKMLLKCTSCEIVTRVCI